MSIYRKYGKGYLDRVVGGILLLVISPLMLLIVVVRTLADPFPVFFIQERSGQFGVPFGMIKFCTLKPAGQGKGFTRFGKILRLTSLDELPQLWHVIQGDMSLVGPRPLPSAYLKHMNLKQKQRLMVKPGITGLAQISGRNKLSWERKFELDCMYSRNLTCYLDAKILLKTPLVVINIKSVVVNFNTAPHTQTTSL